MVVNCEALIMKTIKRTKGFITSYDTLYAAWKEVRRGKTFSDAVIKYESNLAANLSDLSERLKNGSYKPKGYKKFMITEPKPRLVSAPYLEDRIVHHALLMSVLEHLDKKMIPQSFACRKSKGTHKASEQLQKYVRNFNDSGYFLRIDIKKFFYNISHNKLNSILRKYIKCNFALALFEMFYGEDKIGIPLGNVTSQLLANLILNEVDHFAKRELKAKYYLRYMDDIIILSNDKDYLRTALSACRVFIASLELETNKKTIIGKIKNGVDFVGYRTWAKYKLIRKSSLFRIKRTLKRSADMNRVSSFLAHSKNTKSISYVINIIKQYGDLEFINKWIRRNLNENVQVLFST